MEFFHLDICCSNNHSYFDLVKRSTFVAKVGRKKRFDPSCKCWVILVGSTNWKLILVIWYNVILEFCQSEMDQLNILLGF